MILVHLRWLLGLKVVIQLSFAECHSKRIPIEQVNAIHTKDLEKHGSFQISNLNVDSVKHKKTMEEMQEDVEDVLNRANLVESTQFGTSNRNSANLISKKT